jgi:hypothetical protein
MRRRLLYHRINIEAQSVMVLLVRLYLERHDESHKRARDVQKTFPLTGQRAFAYKPARTVVRLRWVQRRTRSDGSGTFIFYLHFSRYDLKHLDNLGIITIVSPGPNPFSSRDEKSLSGQRQTSAECCPKLLICTYVLTLMRCSSHGVQSSLQLSL